MLCLLILAGTILLPAEMMADDNARARKLINSQGCKACHSLDGDGGTLSVSFATMKASLSREQVRVSLVNESGHHGNIKIRGFNHLDHEDIEALVEFIQPQP
jgi:mono/diheme cytochrome c family protein